MREECVGSKTFTGSNELKIAQNSCARCKKFSLCVRAGKRNFGGIISNRPRNLDSDGNFQFSQSCGSEEAQQNRYVILVVKANVVFS